MSELQMAIFQSVDGPVSVLMGEAAYPEALMEMAVERHYGEQHVSPVIGIDMGDGSHAVYDGYRPYDADSYEPGDLLGYVRVVPVADGQHVRV